MTGFGFVEYEDVNDAKDAVDRKSILTMLVLSLANSGYRHEYDKATASNTSQIC